MAVIGEEQGTGVVVVENDLAGSVIATATSATRGVVAERTLTVAPGEIVRWRIGQAAAP